VANWVVLPRFFEPIFGVNWLELEVTVQKTAIQAVLPKGTIKAIK